MPAVTAAAVRSTSPAIQRLSGLLDGLGIEALLAHALVHLGEARRVPELGARSCDSPRCAGCESLMSRPCAAIAASVKRSASAPYSSISSSGSMTLPLVFDIFCALLVAHQGVDVDVVERHLLHEVQAHHHHAGDPEEDDVEAGDQRAGRIEALRAPASCPASPASRTATAPRRTRCRARPRRACSATSLPVVLARPAACASASVSRDEDLAVRPVPRRDPVAPPELARDAPGLDVAHPLEVGLLPVLRHERGLAALDRRDRRLGQLGGVHVPLVGQPRLDDGVAALRVRHGVRVSARSSRRRPSASRSATTLLARGEAVEAAIVLAARCR